MPTYEYRCTGCGHRFDLRQSFQDLPVASCPTCHSQSQRLISAVGIVFKGSGWYVTDSRGSSAGSGISSAEKTEKTDKPEAASEITKAESETSSLAPAQTSAAGVAES